MHEIPKMGNTSSHARMHEKREKKRRRRRTRKRLNWLFGGLPRQLGREYCCRCCSNCRKTSWLVSACVRAAKPSERLSRKAVLPNRSFQNFGAAKFVGDRILCIVLNRGSDRRILRLRYCERVGRVF